MRCPLFILVVLIFGPVFGRTAEENVLPIALEGAVVRATDHARAENIDLSQHYLHAVELVMGKPGEPVWRITWKPKKNLGEIRVAGGEVFLNLYMDQRIEILYGE